MSRWFKACAIVLALPCFVWSGRIDGGGGSGSGSGTGSGTPGGSDTQVQYNNGGAFGGMSTVTYDDGTNTITISSDTVFSNSDSVTFTNVSTVTYSSATYVSFVGTAAFSGLFFDVDLSPGTSGYALKSRGSGLAPQWLPDTGGSGTADNLGNHVATVTVNASFGLSVSTIVFSGSTKPRHRIASSASSGFCQTNSGCQDGEIYQTATSSTMYLASTFQSNTTQYWQFSTTLPKSYVDGGTFTSFVEWSSTSTSTTATWNVDAQAISDDDPLDGSWGTAVILGDTTTAVGDLMRTSESASITAAGSPVGGDAIYFRVYRGNTGDARLIRFIVTFPYDDISSEN